MAKNLIEINKILSEFSDLLVQTSENLEKKESSEKKNLTKELFDQQCNLTTQKIFEKLNYSVISGEFIPIENFYSEIERIIETLSVIISKSNDVKKELQLEFLRHISKPLNLALESYKSFLKELEVKYTIDRIEYLFVSNFKFQDLIKKEVEDISKNAKNHLLFFINTIYVSNLDFFPSTEISQYKTLIEIRHYYKNTSVDLKNINYVLNVHIDFLEHKWKARKQEESYSAINYLQDGTVETLQDFNHDNEKLQIWKNTIEAHYEIYSTWGVTIERNTKSYRKKPLEQLSILQIHQLIKYYKDVDKNYLKLEEISDYLEKTLPLIQTNYDLYCYSVISNYAINNTFSLFVEENKNIDSIKLEYYKAKSKIKGELNNFFLEYKYLTSIINILLEKIEGEDNIQFIIQYEKIVSEECERILKTYYDNKEWSLENSNFIFLLPFNESVVQIENPKTKEKSELFIPSAFVLPPVNNEIEKNYLEVERKFESISFHINTVKRFRKDLEKIELVNNELERKDFKSIEHIGIFTAIVSVVMTSITSFKFIENFEQALYVIITVSSSLFLLLFILFSLTRGIKATYINILYLIGLLGIFFILYHISTVMGISLQIQE